MPLGCPAAHRPGRQQTPHFGSANQRWVGQPNLAGPGSPAAEHPAGAVPIAQWLMTCADVRDHRRALAAFIKADLTHLCARRISCPGSMASPLIAPR